MGSPSGQHPRRLEQRSIRSRWTAAWDIDGVWRWASLWAVLKISPGGFRTGGRGLFFFSFTLTDGEWKNSAVLVVVKLAPSCPEGGWSPAMVDTRLGARIKCPHWRIRPVSTMKKSGSCVKRGALVALDSLLGSTRPRIIRLDRPGPACLSSPQVQEGLTAPGLMAALPVSQISRSRARVG